MSKWFPLVVCLCLVCSCVLTMCVSKVPDVQPVSLSSAAEVENYEVCRVCVEELALYLKPISGAKGLCVCMCVFDAKFLEFQICGHSSKRMKLFVLNVRGPRLSSLCNLAFMLVTLLMTPESCCTFMVLKENAALCVTG